MAYTIEGRKSGIVRFEPEGDSGDGGVVQSESISLSSKVTSNPVEDGSDINDHVINDPTQFSVSGTIVGGEQAATALRAMRDKRDILTYTGRSRLSNLVITALSFDYNAKNKDGCSFKASFQEIIVASSEKVEVGTMPMMSQQDKGKAAPATKKQTSKTSNAGTQTTVTQNISSSAYVAYVNSYSGGSSSGPTTRTTASFSGVQ